MKRIELYLDQKGWQALLNDTAPPSGITKNYSIVKTLSHYISCVLNATTCPHLNRGESLTTSTSKTLVMALQGGGTKLDFRPARV